MEETNYDRAPLEMISSEAQSKTPSLKTSDDPEKTGDIEEKNPNVIDTAVGEIKYTPKTYRQKLSLLDKPRPFILFGMIRRPLIFMTFPVIAYAGFSYGSNLIWFNVLNGTASLILGGAPYNFAASMVGLSYISPLLGVAVGAFYSGVIGDRVIVWIARRRKGILEPEDRLWLFAISLILIPGSLLLWGVGAAHHIHWFGLIAAMFFIAISNSIGVQLSISYCIDSYKDLSGEAMM